VGDVLLGDIGRMLDEIERGYSDSRTG